MSTAKTPDNGADPVDGSPSPPTTRARLLLVSAIVVAGLLVAGLVVFALAQPSPSPGPTPSPSSASLPSATPSASEPGTDSASPTPSEPGGVAVSPSPETDPIDLGETGTIAPGLTAEIVQVEIVDGTARGPGEVAGEALRITVAIANTTSTEASLQTAVVSAYSGPDRDPAPELREPGGRPLPQSVDAMSEVDGVYLFTVPEGARGDVTIIVDYSVDVAPLRFQGDIAELITP